MMDLLKDLGQTAMITGERALKLFWEVLSTASSRLREVTGQHAPQAMRSPPPSDFGDNGDSYDSYRPDSQPITEDAPKTRSAPKVSVAASAQTAPKTRPAKAPSKAKTASKGKTTPKAKAASKAKKGAQKGGQGADERQDQMVRLLKILANREGEWMSAKELSDGSATSGTTIIPGNVRKVIRARGDGIIETRSREGSRRGALEYRLTAAGRDAASG